MTLDEQRSGSSKPSAGEDSRRKAPPWIRMTGAGLELAAITVIFGAIGSAVDGWIQLAKPIGTALGGLIGFSLGMVRFVRLATSTSAKQRAAEARRKREPADGDGQ